MSDIQYLAHLAGWALVLGAHAAVLGALWSRKRRREAECEFRGHVWTNYNGLIDGIECGRCFAKPRRD
jgi:hypothetical protein